MNEEEVWKNIDPEDIWVMDKLILSKKLNYRCGPVGTNVPVSNWYIVRPCVNALGLGLGTQKVWIEKNTDHLPVGHFWCELFIGRHLSIDYHHGTQVLAVEGHKQNNTFTKWDQWIKVNDQINYPSILNKFIDKYEWINCEFINGKLIEVHFRPNLDFENNITYFIPVWKGESINPPDGFVYREYPDVHGRIGAFVK